MDFSLKPEHEQLIQDCLDDGVCGDADELLSEALQLIRQRHRQRKIGTEADDRPAAGLEMVNGILVVKTQEQELSGDLVAQMREERMGPLGGW